MLKRLLVISFVAISFCTFSNRLYAQTTGIGVGLMVGTPTGISAKFWTSNVNAIDLGIGWSNNGTWTHLGNGYAYYYTQSLLHIQVDYVWHAFHVIRSQERLPLYYGFGLHFDSGNTVPTAIGVRGVGGIDWMPRTVPLDVFLEVAPVFYVAPTAGLGFDAGLGARFFFQ